MAPITDDRFPLETTRLSLRPLARSDESALYQLYSDWEVARWLSRLPWPFTQASASSFLTDAAEELRRGSGCTLAMLERTTGMLAGVASLRVPALEPEPRTTDTCLGILGYAVVRDQWGNGFASEGAACVAEFAFRDVDLERLRATVLRSNLRSRRVVERLGFKIAEFGVQETPRYGGPPRLGDIYMLEHDDWMASHIHGKLD